MHTETFLAVYGTLRRAFVAQRGFTIAKHLRFWGYGVARGKLVWQNGFPALIDCPGNVIVEIFRVADPSVWAALDCYEGFFPGNHRRSLFIRRTTRLLHPEIDVSLYFLGHAVPRGSSIGRGAQRPETVAAQNKDCLAPSFLLYRAAT